MKLRKKLLEQKEVEDLAMGQPPKRIEENISSAQIDLELLRAKFSEEQANLKQELFDIKQQISSIDSRRSKKD